MWLRSDVKEDNAESNTEYSGISGREKVAILVPIAFLLLGVNQGHIP